MNNKIKILIIKVKSNEDLIEIQKIGIKNNIGWPNGGRTISYTDRFIDYNNNINFIIISLKRKIMTYRTKVNYLDDNQYVDIDTETNTNERLIINNINELNHFFKFGTLPINYNEPRQLVYESNDYNGIYEICIKIENEKELTELEEIHKKYMGNNQFFQPYHTDENGLDKDGEIFRPCYIFVNFRYKAGISCISESEDIYDIENGGLEEDEDGIFEDVYKKVFIFKKDKNKITNILIHKNINYVSYNEPRQLVYENKNDNIYEICIKVEDENELRELGELYDEHGFTNNELYDRYNRKFTSNDFIYIFLNILRKDYGWEDDDAYDGYNFKSGIITSGISAFVHTYHKIFYFKKDLFKIKKILTDKKINTIINYNEPRQLVYENKINKFNNFKNNMKT